ncbi:chromosome-associated kinesin KIF4-like [Stegodyphus dumicola]|uniref:chromosome-associated kinesin KIF4-like n=1 Tax=Stegodyphus dumicola TaxID=202533 RepID=UPI0015B02132|nr:chromosome-associated kinesin KIF4-like [Stegodyphus dumicola]
MNVVESFDICLPVRAKGFVVWRGMTTDIRNSSHQETDINVENKSSSLVELESSDLKSEFVREDVSTEEITSEQTGVCRKLEALDHQLGIKASLVHYFEGIGEVLGGRETSEDDLNRMKAKIEVLVKEKEALKEALKVSEKKLDEERSRRYVECESEIVSLEKEIRTSKLVKGLKKQTELQIAAFKKEIQGLKKARVELVKQMKQDNIKFRRLQKEKEKEVAQLKQRERKKDFEIVKLKNRFEKHMNVLNQKLAKYKQEKRRSLEKSTMKTAKDKKILQKNINDWLDRDMEVVVCSKLTEFHYQNVEDKLKSTQEEINNLRNSCSSSLSEEKQNLLIKEAEHLKSVLEVHKRKLTELKGDKSDFKDEKSEDRWNEINSMAEAKIALGVLFKKCVSAEVGIEMQKDLMEQEKDQESFNINSYEEKIKVLNDEIADLKENMQRMQSNYEDQITKLNLESQCKALDYLKEMNGLTETASESEKHTSLKNQIEFQAQEISRLSQVAKQFDTLNRENENLKEQLFKAKKGKKVNWMFAPTSGSTSAAPSVPSSSTTYVISLHLYRS